jgi:hypothetical protein
MELHIQKMRQQCPHFHQRVSRLEAVTPLDSVARVSVPSGLAISSRGSERGLTISQHGKLGEKTIEPGNHRLPDVFQNPTERRTNLEGIKVFNVGLLERYK